MNEEGRIVGEAEEIVYLACPYSHGHEEIRKLRFLVASRKAAELMRQGLLVFSPLSHSRALEPFGLPVEWEFWQYACRAFLRRCDSMIVLRLPGWDTSTGVTAEIALMEEMGKPISYVDP